MIWRCVLPSEIHLNRPTAMTAQFPRFLFVEKTPSISRLRAIWYASTSLILGSLAGADEAGIDAPDLPTYEAEEEHISMLPTATSTTRIGGREVELWNLPAPSEFSERIPNLHVTTNSLRSFGDIYALRGITNTPFFSSPAVALYIDGVAIGNVYTYSLLLRDVASATIHRGPQGARFGHNSAGGVIEIQTRQPPEHLGGSISTSFGEFGSRSVQFTAAGPLIPERLSLKIAGDHRKRGAFMTNRTFRDNTDTRQALGGFLEIDWRVDDVWSLVLGLNVDRFDDGSQLITPLKGNWFEVDSDFEGATRINRDSQFLRIEADLPSVKVSSVSSRHFWKLDPNRLDLDLSPLPGFTSTIRQEQLRWTEEFVLRSASGDAAPWNWRAGLFLSKGQVDGKSTRTFLTPPLPEPIPVVQETSFQQITETAALFGHFTRILGDRMEIGLGFRYDSTAASIDRVKTDNFLPPRIVTGELRRGQVAPELEFKFLASESISFSTRIAKGFKPGGFSPYTDDPDHARFESETLWSAEASVGFNTLEERLSLRLSGFLIQIEDFQVERSFTFTDYIILNAPQARSRGFEFESQFRPSERLTFASSFGYTRIEFEEYTDPFTNVDYAGNRAPYSPEYTLLLSGTYEFRNGLYSHVEMLSAGTTFFDEANRDRFSQDSYGLINLRVGYRNDRFDLSLFARNLTDTRFYTNKITDLEAGTPGQPRLFGVDASINF